MAREVYSFSLVSPERQAPEQIHLTLRAGFDALPSLSVAITLTDHSLKLSPLVLNAAPWLSSTLQQLHAFMNGEPLRQHFPDYCVLKLPASQIPTPLPSLPQFEQEKTSSSLNVVEEEKNNMKAVLIGLLDETITDRLPFETALSLILHDSFVEIDQRQWYGDTPVGLLCPFWPSFSPALIPSFVYILTGLLTSELREISVTAIDLLAHDDETFSALLQVLRSVSILSPVEINSSSSSTTEASQVPPKSLEEIPFSDEELAHIKQLGVPNLEALLAMYHTAPNYIPLSIQDKLVEFKFIPSNDDSSSLTLTDDSAQDWTILNPEGSIHLKVKMISTVKDLEACCCSIRFRNASSAFSDRLLSIDIEGKNLGRNGTISIIQLYSYGDDTVYLIDILTLGAAAFDPLSSDQNMRLLLESEAFPKLFFDPRKDADALFHLFNVYPRGVICIQMLNAVYRISRNKQVARHVFGLAKVIAQDSHVAEPARSQFLAIKSRGKKLFALEEGGDPDIFDSRPLPTDLALYCALDVILLPNLYFLYTSHLKQEWLLLAMRETEARIAQIKQPELVGGAGCPPVFWEYAAHLGYPSDHLLTPSSLPVVSNEDTTSIDPNPDSSPFSSAPPTSSSQDPSPSSHEPSDNSSSVDESNSSLQLPIIDQINFHPTPPTPESLPSVVIYTSNVLDLPTEIIFIFSPPRLLPAQFANQKLLDSLDCLPPGEGSFLAHPEGISKGYLHYTLIVNADASIFENRLDELFRLVMRQQFECIAFIAPETYLQLIHQFAHRLQCTKSSRKVYFQQN